MYRISFFYFTLACLFLAIFGCNSPADNPSFNEEGKIVYFTGAEKINKKFFVDSLGQFEGGDNQSEVRAFEGKYSMHLDSIKSYGFQFHLEKPQPGELIQASVWRYAPKNNGSFYCSIKGERNSTIKSTILQEKNGWEQLSINFITDVNIDEMLFFVSSGGGDVYYDNLEIVRFEKSGLENYREQALNIFIPEKSKDLLDGYIEHGVKKLMIVKAAKKYVDAFIIDQGDSIPIKMRIKGDWSDHLLYGKISYRIKVLGNKSYRGLKSFSIQHPRTRNYMHEWVFHRVMDTQNLLSTTYDFVPVTVNDNWRGVFALEEHFDKQLIESRQRREGPVLKLDEQAMWASSVYSKERGLNNNFPFYEVSTVGVFKKNRTLKSETLSKEFEEGAKLLEMFKNYSEDPKDIFDIEAIAKFFAILEFTDCNHGLAWHNRRFYYNPVTSRLEMIGFDLIPFEQKHAKKYANVKEKLKLKKQRPEGLIDLNLLLNPTFRKYYLKYLTDFSKDDFWDKQFEAMKKDIDIRQKLLAVEQKQFTFDRELYYEKAASMRNLIPEIDSLWDVFEMKHPVCENFIKNSKYGPFTDTTFLKEVSLNIYVHKLTDGTFKASFQNYHPNKVQVIGWYAKGSKEMKKIEEPIKLMPYAGKKNVETLVVNFSEKPTKFAFEINNWPNKIFTKKPLKWAIPQGETSRMELAKSFDAESDFYTIVGDDLTFRQGSYEIDQLIFIPEKYRVKFLPNTTIDLVRGGGIVVNNSLVAVGKKSAKIAFQSSDKDNHGITVLKGDEVVLKHVSFDNLDALHYKNWTLTGAVTVYESTTTIENCTFNANLCEDALNIIRSRFDISGITISNTFSDGFDADFCTGIITHSTFLNTGNDCIDFSGSEVTIKDIVINKSGDKGISGGERSLLVLSNIVIDNAIVGIAAKDATEISGENIQISQVEFHLAAFQKKTEYGVASIVLEHVKGGNEYLIDTGSEICVNGDCVVGTQSLDIDKLYARFEK